MLKVTSQIDCGNAPKKQYIHDFCVANAQGDSAQVGAMLAPDISMVSHGYATASGVDEVVELLQQDINRAKVVELILDTIVTHGNQAAANGIIKFADGNTVNFCTMFAFNSFGKNAKLKRIQAYSIPGNDKEV